MDKYGGITFKATGDVDTAAIMARLNKIAHRAQEKLDAQVMADSNYFCPLKSSTLQKSAQISTRIGSGCIVWRTPYARAQYYGVNFDHSRSKNPNARAKWFEAAKAQKMKNWERLVQDEFKR